MESEALISVPEAAKLLGVHPNTIRNRVKSGQYSAEWTQSSHGPKQLIPRDQVLGVSIPTADEQHQHALTFIEPRGVTLETSLQQVLSPFLERLESTLVEVGTLRESRRQLDELNQKLAAEVAQLRGERLRQQAELERLRLLAETRVAVEPAANVAAPRSWWRRIFSPV